MVELFEFDSGNCAKTWAKLCGGVIISFKIGTESKLSVMLKGEPVSESLFTNSEGIIGIGVGEFTVECSNVIGISIGSLGTSNSKFLKTNSK